jgi:sugar phosphate isomerase/epimerase
MYQSEIGMSTAALYPIYPTEDALTTAADLGFRVAEVFLQSEEEHSANFGVELDRRRRATGICIHSLHLHTHYFNLWTPYVRRAEETRERFLRTLDLANRVEAQALTWHGIGSQFGFQLLSAFMDSVAWAAEHAHSAGVTLCIENVSWCYLRTPEQVNALNNLGVPIGFTFDTFQAGESGGNPVTLIHAMGAQLKTVHLADYDPAGPRHLPLGDGTLDWHAILRALTDVDYPGPLIIELADVETLNTLTASRDFISQMLRQDLQG